MSILVLTIAVITIKFNRRSQFQVQLRKLRAFKSTNYKRDLFTENSFVKGFQWTVLIKFEGGKNASNQKTAAVESKLDTASWAQSKQRRVETIF